MNTIWKLASAGAAVLLPWTAATSAHADDAVTRPYWEHGSGTFDLVTEEVQLTTQISQLGRTTDDGTAIVAANGDRIDYEAIDGPFTDPSCGQDLVRRAERLNSPAWGAFDEYYEFTGGTGRFEGATGTTHTVVCFIVRPELGVAEVWFESRGTITY